MSAFVSECGAVSFGVLKTSIDIIQLPCQVSKRTKCNKEYTCSWHNCVKQALLSYLTQIYSVHPMYRHGPSNPPFHGKGHKVKYGSVKCSDCRYPPTPTPPHPHTDAHLPYDLFQKMFSPLGHGRDPTGSLLGHRKVERVLMIIDNMEMIFAGWCLACFSPETSSDHF